jgi:orotidine-5'-phosphate decarboxylase
MVKIGMEFFYAHGAAGYGAIAAEGAADLPRPEAARHPQYGHAALASLMRLEPAPAIVNVHATGGPR